MNIDLSNVTSYAPFIPSAAELAIDVPLWRALPASSGGYHFELAGEFHFPTGADNIRSR